MKKILVALFWIAAAYAAVDFALAWKARMDFSSEVSEFLKAERDQSMAGQRAREERGTSAESEIMNMAEDHGLDLYYEDIQRDGKRLYVTFGQTIVFREWVYTKEF